MVAFSSTYAATVGCKKAKVDKGKCGILAAIIRNHVGKIKSRLTR